MSFIPNHIQSPISLSSIKTNPRAVFLCVCLIPLQIINLKQITKIKKMPKKTTPQTLKSICCCYCFCCSFCCPLSNRVLFIMFVIWAWTYDIILNSRFRFFSERWLALNGHQQLSTFSIFMKLFKATHTNTETERYLYKKWTVGVECSLSLFLSFILFRFCLVNFARDVCTSSENTCSSKATEKEK